MNIKSIHVFYPLLIAIFLTVAMTTHVAVASQDIDWSDSDSTNLRTLLEKGTYGTITSVLILHEGNPIFEHYSNGADETTLHNTRSVTKTITSMAVGLAVDDGILDTDTRVARFFADIAPFDNPDIRKLEITVEDLLTMSSPLECDDWNSYSRGNEERMYIVEDWSSFFWDLPIRGFPSWAPKTQSAPYSRAFSYCTAGIQILGETVERATNTLFTDYVETRLFAPLGIKAFEWPRNGAGKAHLGGGLLLTTRGLARFAELQRQGGRYNGRKILSAYWTDASVEPKTAIPDGKWKYGYLWWLRSYIVGESTYLSASMNGNGGNRVTILSDFGISVVITKTDYNSREMHSKTDKFFENEIVARLAAK